MKSFIFILLLVPLLSFSQDLDLNCTGCWVEYKIEPEIENHCPLLLCPDGSICCIQKVDNELYKSSPGWTILSEKRIRFDGDEPTYFKVIKWTENELIIEFESSPTTVIYFSK